MAKPGPTEPQRQNPFRLGYKVVAYVVAWVLALLATGPGLWPLAYMFPLGLIGVFNRHLANDGGWAVLIGCYVAYVVQASFYFRSKTPLSTVVLYAVLLLMLIGNVAGCHDMAHPH